MGYYWPNMNKDVATIHEECQKCRLLVDKEESYVVFVTEDWRTPFMEYLAKGILPTDRTVAHKLRKLFIRYFLQNGILFKSGYSGDPLRCLGPREAREVVREVHSGDYGSHLRKRRVYRQLLQQGYYWPTTKKDFEELVKTCHACQVLGNAIHTHPNVLKDMTTPWSFHTWGLDLIGPINPPSNGHIWILVVTEYFTKWVEVIPLKKATGTAMANFI